MRPVLISDHWGFLADLQRVAAGKYTVWDLLRPHNEHRILTSRLSFFVDTHLFDMSNRSLVVTVYAAMMAIGVFVVRQSLGPAAGWRAWAVCLPLALGVLWSPVQYGNFYWGFQPQFPYVHLFAALTIGSFAALAQARTAWGFASLLALTVSFDFLTIYSMGSGLFVVVAIVGVALWLRTPWRATLSALAGHAVLSATYFIGFRLPRSSDPTLNPVEVLAYGSRLLGKVVDSTETVAGLAGALGLALFLTLGLWMLRRSWMERQLNDRPAAVLLSLAGFVVTEAFLVGISRFHYISGDIWIPSRYATLSAVFWVALLGATWRTLKCVSTGRERPLPFCPATPVLAAGALLVATSNLLDTPYATWDHLNRELDVTAFAMVNGVESEAALLRVHFRPSALSDRIHFLRERQLGPFGPGAERYQLPFNSVHGLDPERLPTCSGRIDKVEPGQGSTRLTGWIAVHRSNKRAEPATWLAVYDKDRTIVAYSKPVLPRSDVQAVYRGEHDRYGFDLHVPAFDPTATRLVALGPTGLRACTLRPAAPQT
ncbi:MAG TPA: hypothetical protein VIL09_10985 [Microvirga sp.]|jgi:hypothetical protein